MARTFSQGISQFYLHTHTFIRSRNEPYLPLPSQPQLVLIYRPRRDGWLSRPWCEVVPAEIRTCKLPIANPALYHAATSALANVVLFVRTVSRKQSSLPSRASSTRTLRSAAVPSWTRARWPISMRRNPTQISSTLSTLRLGRAYR